MCAFHSVVEKQLTDLHISSLSFHLLASVFVLFLDFCLLFSAKEYAIKHLWRLFSHFLIECCTPCPLRQRRETFDGRQSWAVRRSGVCDSIQLPGRKLKQFFNNKYETYIDKNNFKLLKPLARAYMLTYGAPKESQAGSRHGVST